ncbi:MAG: di-trans,poly-cis-decaprenylcistransferase [Candidatus Pacebacteria bacterium]|nr:di-trans,poly-cis-decaprenylcistransferase [Candidatus Paceibacterota bacterium]
MSDKNIPKHVAIICDGNRRWAREHRLPVFEGHRRAVDKVFDELIDAAVEKGVEYLTFWIFSTENWQRDKKEVEGLMNLFRWFFDSRINDYKKRDIKFNMIGNLDHFDKDIQKRIIDGMEKTKDCSKITVTLAMSYGGRDELTRAVNKIIDQGIKEVTPEIISKNLDTDNIPDPEFIIRTSGENRMSGFLLWQSYYAEFYFPEYHFPEFDKKKFNEALDVFFSRKRRFGK